MKKFSILIALMLVLAMASGAFAAQASYTGAGGNDQKYYSSTTPAGVITSDPTYVKSRVYGDNQFKADGKTNYPYEIYLPNEVTPANYRIHSNYTKNTDACAACHATHTAVGNSLLQWYTVYDTCMACHDGTVTTTYNVEHGVIGSTGKATFGGMFGNGAETSLSSHNVTGAVEIAAAPGGSAVAETVNKANGSGTTTRWTTEFGCESCHTPHGQGGNARILNPDPNLVATQNKKSGVVLTETVTSLVYAVYPSGDATKTPYTWIKGYPYSKTTVIKDDVYATSTGISSSKYTIDNSNGYTFIKFDKGYTPSGSLTADFYPSVKVAMTISNYLTTSESVTHKSGMNAFCGACHTDYNTEGFVNPETSTVNSGSADAETGTYSKAHRHQVGFYYGYSAAKLAAASMVLENGNMECLTCHVAHGTSTDYWTRTVGSTSTTAGRLTAAYLTDDTLTELAGSSALKRLPNMGTCEACHAKGDGNQGYSANTGQADVLPVTGGQTDAVFTLSASNVFANFKGSASCASCHKEQYDGWKTTIHKTMVQDATVAANWMPTDPQIESNLSNLQSAYRTATGDATATFTVAADFKSQVKYLLGSKWKQRFIVSTPTKGLIVLDGVKVQFYNADKTWNNYGGSTTVGGKAWSADCALCHTTGLDISAGAGQYGAGDGNTDVKFAEAGISCEACHGAGANHVKTPSAKNINGIAGIAQKDQVAICGKCHNRGFDNVYRTYNNDGSRVREDYYGAYKAGTMDTFDGLNSTFGLVYNTEGNWTKYGIWNNFKAAYGKATLSDTGNVFGDETAAGHHQQFNEFVQSGHFKSGLLTCTTCHNPHGKNVDNSQLKAQAQTVCASCHDAGLNLNNYMPYISRSAAGFPYDSKNSVFTSTYGNGGGDLRSHAFKTNWDYNKAQTTAGTNTAATDWINLPTLK